jgi:hypothetical protein
VALVLGRFATGVAEAWVVDRGHDAPLSCAKISELSKLLAPECRLGSMSQAGRRKDMQQLLCQRRVRLLLGSGADFAQVFRFSSLPT